MKPLTLFCDAKLVCIDDWLVFLFFFPYDYCAYLNADSLYSSIAEGRLFTLHLRVVHVRDLNFVLRSKIFVHTGRQLRASHLILGCTPVYKTWQPFSQALSVDSPLLSYIDVRHANFLPPSLTTGKARDLGPHYIIVEDLAPIRDESAERVSQAFREWGHVPIEKNEGQS